MGKLKNLRWLNNNQKQKKTKRFLLGHEILNLLELVSKQIQIKFKNSQIYRIWIKLLK